ncbi:MAG: Protein phosphatase methylesterase 1 [Alyxoria varia]|nr:MAG: Protein phosphatase methylesterase 1 [Alyxoria varia]
MAWPPSSDTRSESGISHEEDLEGDSSSTSSISTTGTIVPTSSNQMVSHSSSWHKYFDQELFLEDGGLKHHVYITAPKSIEKDPLFVCHHGAGSSGLSFSLLAAEIRKRMPLAGVLSIDARGHGDTTPLNGPETSDFSRAAMGQDLVKMIELTKLKLGWSALPNLLLIGHSAGGAVVTEVAKQGVFGSKLVGFAVLDVVEGSALEALKAMNSHLENRPNSFPTVDAAVDWHVRTRTIRNPTSASASVPSIFRKSQSGDWVWRTDLPATKEYWEDWFTGMSSNFLAGKAAKLLILAGTDRLDKELMIGQMQGKFQLQVFPEAGHFVHEDSPEKTADTVVEFFRRNDRSALVLPPKVGDLIAQGKKV